MMKSLLLAATLALASVAAIGGTSQAFAADTGGGRGGNGAGGTGEPGGNGGSGGSDGILRLGEPGNIPGGPGAVHRHPRPRPLPGRTSRPPARAGQGRGPAGSRRRLGERQQ